MSEPKETTSTAGSKRKESPVAEDDAKIDGSAKRAKVNKVDEKVDEVVEKANEVESTASKDAIVA